MELGALFELKPVFEEADWVPFHDAGIRVKVLREDLRHPVVGGNKLWKLRYALDAFHQSGSSCIVSFGGAYSNHLAALSSVCRWYGIQFHAVVRGEEQSVNARIARMLSEGTFIHYCSRDWYRKKEDVEMQRQLLNGVGISHDAFIIPEGGNSPEGRSGCFELGKLIPSTCSHFLLACGTGATMAGAMDGMNGNTNVIGIPVVRSGGALEQLMKTLHPDKSNYRMIQGYEEAGYGRSSSRLDAFIHTFTRATGIPLEPVYTGKLFFAVDALAKSGYFLRGDEVVVLHSGGIL